LFIINQQFKTFIMAVEKAKVIARLKALFPKANLSQKRLDALADKLATKPADDADDVAIDVVINDFNSILSIDEIAREDDRVRTLEAKANPPAPTPKPTDPPTPATPPADVPEWAKGLVEANKSLLEKVTAIESGNVIESKKQTALKSFDNSEILKGLKPELKDRWVNRIDVNSETPIEDQIKELETEYSELVQVNADGNSYGGAAGSGSSNQKPDQAIVDEIVNNQNI